MPLNPETALATQEQPPKGLAKRRTRKRSRVQLNSTATAQEVTLNQSAQTTAPGQVMALSAVDAFKVSTVNAYSEGMKQAVPELFNHFEQVNTEVAEWMTQEIESAYGVTLTYEEAEA